MRFRPYECFSKLLIHSQAALSRKGKPSAYETPTWVLVRGPPTLPRVPTAALQILPRASLPQSQSSRAAAWTREPGSSSSTCRRCWSSDSTTLSAATRTSWPRYSRGALPVLGGFWPGPASPLLASPSSPLPGFSVNESTLFKFCWLCFLLANLYFDSRLTLRFSVSIPPQLAEKIE